MVENMLLVLSVVEGFHFPKRPHHQLLIEANFDNEVLTTDAVKHIDSPKFNTELAWEIDKKSLHQHRLQRTPIKLQVFAIETSSMRKEMVGYCIIDLRTAQTDEKKKATWFNLLNSKYHNLKPRIKLALGVEQDQVKGTSPIVAPKTRNIEKKSNLPEKESPSDGTTDLDVVLDDEEGYYVMGPEVEDCKTFVLSVSINGIKSLVNLLPSSAAVEAENGFYFYYSLLDNDVTNETFYELMTPTIPTERASVRIHTTVQRLDAYLKHKKSLKVYLCSGDTTLGESCVPLDNLTDSNNNYKLPSIINGMFPLFVNKSTSDAYVGVSIVLRREDQPLTPQLSPVQGQTGKQMTRTDELLLIRTQSPQSPPTRLHVQQKDNREIKKNQKSPKRNVGHNASPPKLEKEHHFVFSVDLRSIGDMDISNPVYCYCRYSYPFFGSSAPILTNPPVYLQRNCEVVLPQSFCQFEFAATPEALQATLSRVPLIIEIWSKDMNQRDVLLGIAQIQLSSVFFSDKRTQHGPQVNSEKILIVNSQRPGQKLGYLHVVLGFHDQGELNVKFEPRKVVQQSSSSTINEDSSLTQSTPDGGNKPPGRSAQEYQVAMALELWRQQQEEHFKSQLKSREEERMRSLAEEWKQRDIEREMLLKRKMQEFTSLETNLKASLIELEKRQKHVTDQEMLLEKNQVRLAEEYDRKMVDMREASRRLKEEYQHQLQIEKSKQKELEERFQRLSIRHIDLETRLKERDNDVITLKESLVKRPEVKIQSDMNLLLIEKNELERKIETVTKSKIHYKQQWGRALRELARIKMNEQEEAKGRLKRQQQELDHMKLRYLAAEEKQIIQSEKDELCQVKDEIDKRLQGFQGNLKQPINENADEVDNVPSYGGSDRVAKLIEERDTLLQTGVYTTDDPVIFELDKEIRQMISKNG